MSLFDLLWSICNQIMLNILHLIGMKKRVDTNMSSVTVKFKSQPCIELQINNEWTVKDLKEELSKKLKLPSSDMKLIFAGKELPNSTFIEEYEVGQQSIIHAVPSLKSQNNNANQNRSENERVFAKITDNLDPHKEAKKKTGFFVYCNTCKGLQRGKLRVRCNVCKEGTLTVNSDPCGWDDVLIPGRILGICQSENCDGNIAEFYFKCANHTSSDEETAVALYQIKANTLDVTCLSCIDVSDVVMIFTCADAHVICIDCFILYCTSKLNERQFLQHPELGYTLGCPVGCENSYIKETHHFRLLGDEQYARYQRFGTEEYLLQVGGVLCPIPGCGAGIIPDPDCDRVVCSTQGGQGCGFVFCKKCLQGYHIGECINEENEAAANSSSAFAVIASQVSTSRWDTATLSTIKVTTKPCPKCRTPTERDGGCMHMVCTRANCGFHWCWICQTEWTRGCMADHWFG